MPNRKGRRPGTRRIEIWHKGKRREWVIEGTKVDGDKFEARKRLELAAQEIEARAVPKFSQICKEYALHAESHLKESTWKLVRVYQVATLSHFFGAKRGDEITGADVDAFKRHRLTQLHRGKPVSPVAVNNDLRVFSAIRSWARDAGYTLPQLKWKKIPVRGNDRVKFWTEHELDLIFASTRRLYPDLVPMFVTLLNTGMRKGEALAAEWSWFDFDRSMVTIPATETWQPKNGHSRDVPMADAVRAVLSGERRHAVVVFPSSLGKRYESFPKDSFWAILRDAKVKGNPHMFRHTFASNFLAAIPDLKLLAEILGHSTTRVTEIYSHLLPGRLDRARNAVNLIPKTAAVTAAEKKKVRISR